MTNSPLRALARISLILASLVAGILNGSVLAAPILILAAYLLCILVRQGRAAVTLYEAERLQKIQDYARYDAALTLKIWEGAR